MRNRRRRSSGSSAVAEEERVLDRDRRRDRCVGGFEHGEHAGHVDDTAMIRVDDSPEDRARGIKGSHRGLLVCRHQAGIFGRVRCENRPQSLLEFRVLHSR